MFQVKRVYAEKASDDGKRYLVDRIWPRGLTKEKAGLDAWLQDLAPSGALRLWFHHDPGRWEEFQKRYREELAEPQALALIARLRDEGKSSQVTLLFAAKDLERNNAVCLKNILEDPSFPPGSVKDDPFKESNTRRQGDR
jgi:uncharacterized protein YeaO (DUF488 family)